jgi:hypothetical protein
LLKGEKSTGFLSCCLPFKLKEGLTSGSTGAVAAITDFSSVLSSFFNQ